MNIYAVVQIRNEEKRIEEWVKYHSNLGVHKFIIFDDWSTDNTEKKVIELSKTYNIYCEKSERIGEYKEYTNPNEQPYDVTIREIRQYNIGTSILQRECAPEDWCIYINVDEFVVPQISPFNLNSFLQNISENRVYIDSYDFKCPFNLDEPVLPQTFMRWSDTTRSTGNVPDPVSNEDRYGYFKNRGKSIGKIKRLANILCPHNLHGGSYFQNKDILKINHYRNNSQLPIFDYEDKAILQWIQK